MVGHAIVGAIGPRTRPAFVQKSMRDESLETLIGQRGAREQRIDGLT